MSDPIVELFEIELVEELSAAEIEARIAELPDAAKELLAEGPWPEPMCGVCRALLDLANDEGSRPASELLDYHDTPFRRHFNTKNYREGNEVYARCLEIYRAAGWSG